MAHVLTAVASFVSWHRRLVGGFLAAAAVLLTIQALSAPPPPTVDVAIITANLPAGHTLTPGDVDLRALPAGGAPSDALREVVVGRSLAASLSAGTVLQPGLLTGSSPTPPGRAVVPIVVPDERLRALLQPGDAVTLVVTGAESAAVLTNDARIAALPAAPAEASALDLRTRPASELVLVDVPVAEAATVASLGQGGQLSVVLGTV